MHFSSEVRTFWSPNLPQLLLILLPLLKHLLIKVTQSVRRYISNLQSQWTVRQWRLEIQSNHLLMELDPNVSVDAIWYECLTMPSLSTFTWDTSNQPTSWPFTISIMSFWYWLQSNWTRYVRVSPLNSGFGSGPVTTWSINQSVNK